VNPFNRIQSWFQNRKLFVKLITISFVPLLPALIFAPLFLWFSISQSVQQQAGKRLQEIAFNVIDKLDRNLFERYGDVQVFSQSAEARSMQAPAITAWMRTVTKSYSPIYNLMMVADRKGKIIAVVASNSSGQFVPQDTTSKLLDQDVSSESWFQTAIEGQIPVGKAHIEDVHRDPYLSQMFGFEGAIGMSFSAPIRDAKGQIVGVWSNRTNWQVALRILDEIKSQSSGENSRTLHLHLLNTGGLILNDAKAENVLQTSVLERKSYLAAQKQPMGFIFDQPSLTEGKYEVVESWARSKGYSSYPGVGWQILAEQSKTEIMSRDAQALIFNLLVIGVLLLLLLLAMGLINRYIVGRIRAMVRAANRLALGDTQHTLEGVSRDELGDLTLAMNQVANNQAQMSQVAQEIGQGNLRQIIKPRSEQDGLGQAFVQMNHGLCDMVTSIKSNSEQMQGASSGLLLSASQQASSVTQQSAAIAQTTATIEQVKASADQAVDLANTVNKNAQMASKVAQNGVETLKATTTGMDEIRERVSKIAEHILALSEQTQQIDEIITSVNDLADQSNLLALNAAIEASRAGEHGRGFSVVAQEIRLLAEQSKAATTQVRSILSDIQRATHTTVMATEQGIKVADVGSQNIAKMNHTISELSEAIKQAAYSAQLISASVQQHSIGMEQISTAMMDINNATSSNLTISRHTRAAAEQLDQMASSLGEMVSHYQT
jgi:methyl-accepting chemotaxis protein